MSKTKLTPIQNKTIFFLQQGGILVTDCDMRGAIVCCKKSEFKINNKTFWNLHEKGFIYQENIHFNYVLTEAGEEAKTTPVHIKQ